MDSNKIAIIVYREDDKAFETLIEEFKHVEMPEGYECTLIETMDETGNIGKAYNEAVASSDAKIKIFLRENTRNIDTKLLVETVRVFNSNSEIGILGVLGYNVIFTQGQVGNKEEEPLKDSAGNPIDVLAIENQCVMTQYDMKWREDMESFRLSTYALCTEYRRNNYKVSVLDRSKRWLDLQPDREETTEAELDSFLDEYSKDIYPLVSILIPTHERPEWFTLALESALQQTYRNIDLVVTDNSEDDRTEEIVKESQKTHPHIRYYHIPGASALENWQTSMDKAQSEYISYLLDDDLFLPNKVAEMMNYFFVNPSVRIVTSYRQLIDADGNVLPDAGFSRCLFEKTEFIPGEEAGKLLLTQNFNWIGEFSTAIFRQGSGKYKVHIGGWSGTEKNVIDDYGLWLQLMELGGVIYIPQPLSQFRQHSGNGTREYRIHINGCISMGTIIQEAWNKKKFLNNENDLKKAISAWFGMTVGILEYGYETGYQSEEFNDLEYLFNELSSSFTKRQVDEFIILEKDN